MIQIIPFYETENSVSLVLNNFSGIGHYIEMVPASVLNNSAMYEGNSSNGNGQCYQSSKQPLENLLW